MNIQNIDVSSYPNSEKIYINGSIFPDLRVGMRRIRQYPTVEIIDGKRIEHPNEEITVYDTSGPYTDPAVTPDINKGLPRDREVWVEQRGDTERLDDITSEYGRSRRAMRSLDDIRFPVFHRPRRARECHPDALRPKRNHHRRNGICGNPREPRQ